MKFVSMRKTLVLVITIMLAAVTIFPAFAQAITTKDTWTQPYSATLTACNGEEVSLSGEIRLSLHTTLDSRGGSHTTLTITPHHVLGAGLLTGTRYRAVGGDREHSYYTPNGIQQTYTNTGMYNLVSQGNSDNFKVKYTFHVTTNANGEVTVVIDKYSEVCVG